MVAVVAMIAILMILMTVGVQEWQQILRRDKEAEMMFRAQEIVRAIFRFQQANGRLPLELKELLEPLPNTGAYILRHDYKDPLVKGGQWGLLYSGPGGEIIDPSSAPTGEEGETAGGLARLGPTTEGTAAGRSGGGLGGGAGRLGGTGTAGGAQGSSGLPIIGVKSLCTDTPFRVYRGLSDYSQWLFTIQDLQAKPGQVPGQGQGQPGTGTPGDNTRPGPRPPGSGAAGRLPGGPGGAQQGAGRRNGP